MANGSQRIQMRGGISAERPVVFGVPLGDIARRHGINVQLYADDTQLYLAFSWHSDEDTIQVVTRVQGCGAENG